MNRSRQKRRFYRWTAIVLSLCLGVVFPVTAQAEDMPMPDDPVIGIAAPTMLPAVIDEYGAIVLNWEYPYSDGDEAYENTGTTDADGYELYRCANPGDEYLPLADTYYTTYKDSTAEPGITYSYKVRAYRYEYVRHDEDGYTYWIWEKIPGEFSNTIEIVIAIGRPTVTLLPVNEKTVKVQWEEVAWASGYIIERKSKSDTVYTVVAEIQKSGGGSYTDTNLTFGEKYYYRVRVYRDVLGIRIYGKYSSAKSVVVTMAAPKIKSIKVSKPDTAQITWNPVNKAQGYKVYRLNEDGVYKCVKTLTGNQNCTVSIKKLVNGTTYSYIVRAYTSLNDSRLYGVYSTPKDKVMDYYGYETEYWYLKVKRIFKKDTPVTYSSSKAAGKNMKTIVIKVWRIDSNGKKFTKITYLTVHKEIAPTVQQIFKEIYEGKDKFPIHTVGGYDWRSNLYSEHNRGLAIDINSRENYMIRDGKIIAGSFWKPKTNVYSIPEDGDVVRIMRKYGFIWGGTWRSSKDYMHFSYFGG